MASKRKYPNKNKKLYRSKKDKLVAGVLGGMATYFDTDATVIRVGFIVLLAFTGFFPGVVAYAVATLLMPLK